MDCFVIYKSLSFINYVCQCQFVPITENNNNNNIYNNNITNDNKNNDLKNHNTFYENSQSFNVNDQAVVLRGKNSPFNEYKHMQVLYTFWPFYFTHVYSRKNKQKQQKQNKTEM